MPQGGVSSSFFTEAHSQTQTIKTNFSVYLLSQSPVWLEERMNLGVLTKLLPMNPAISKLSERNTQIQQESHFRKHACVNILAELPYTQMSCGCQA